MRVILILISVIVLFSSSKVRVLVSGFKFDEALSVHTGLALCDGAIGFGTASGYVLHEY